MMTIIGGSNIDLYGHHGQAGSSIAGSAIYDDSTPGVVRYHAGGVGRNIAENLGRLGCRPYLITALGGDSHADLIKASLTDAGVNTEHVVHYDDARSDSYMAIYQDDGQLITAVNDMGLIERLTRDSVTPHLEMMKEDDVIVMDGNISDEIIHAVCTHDADFSIGFDSVSTHKAVKIKPYLTALSLLKCNRQEAAVLTGLPVEALDFDHARALRDRGVETVIMSDGAQGFLIGHKDGYERFEPEPIDSVVNVSGAGDALMAGIIYGLSQRMDIPTIGKFAAQLARLSLSCDGPVHPEGANLIKGDTV